MSLQDKYNDYKERQETKKYFRQNNDQFLDTNQWMKVIAFGLISSVLMGIVHSILVSLLKMDFSLFYIVIGYFMSKILVYAAGVQSKSVAWASAVFTVLTFFIDKIIIVLTILMTSGADFPMMLSMIPFCLEMVFNVDVLDLIFIVVGACVAYQQAE